MSRSRLSVPCACACVLRSMISVILVICGACNPPPADPSGGDKCSRLRCPPQLSGGVSGCQVSNNCPMPPVAWTDTCHPNAAGAFVETVNWGDGGPNQTIVGANQGCVQGTCKDDGTTTSTFATSYFAPSQHVYTSAGRKSVVMTIDSKLLNESQACTVSFIVTVDP